MSGTYVLDRHLEKFSSIFFSLKATWLCLNRVCHASNSIPSEFGANRSWSLILVKTDVWDVCLGSRHLENFSPKIFFLKFTRLCLNRVCHALNSICSEFGANRSWSPIFQSWTYVLDVCLGSRHLENFSSKIFFLKFTRLCLNRVCHALNSMCSEFGPNRSWSPIFQSWTYVLDLDT